MPQPEYVQRGYLREDFRLFHLKGPMEEQLDWHYHTFHKLIFFLGGTSSYGLEGRSYPLEAGDVIRSRRAASTGRRPRRARRMSA
ncbi:MAG: hypothetical protein V8S99_03875 [Oscillospiraceae bacterium]